MIDFLEQLVNCLLAAIFSLVIIGLCAVPVALFIWMVWWLLLLKNIFIEINDFAVSGQLQL